MRTKDAQNELDLPFNKGNRGKHAEEIYFCYLRVRSASLDEISMRVCDKQNGGWNISKRENIKLLGQFSPIIATVLPWEQRILIK